MCITANESPLMEWSGRAPAPTAREADKGHQKARSTPDSTTVRAHVSAAGGKEGFINELLAARGAGSPVKFIVSVMPEAGARRSGGLQKLQHPDRFAGAA